MEIYPSKVRGKEESVYDKVVRQFRELEKNADKYFDNLDAVEEMCYKAKKDFRLKAEADKKTIEERCCREGQIVFVGPGDESSSYQRRAEMLK